MIIEVKNMKSYYVHFPKIKSRFYFLYYYKTMHNKITYNKVIKHFNFQIVLFYLNIYHMLENHTCKIS